MATTIRQLEDDTYDYCTRLLPNHSVIFENFDIPSPGSRTVSILIKEDASYNHDTTQLSLDGTSETIRGLTRINTVISCWELESRSAAGRLRAGLYSANSILDVFANAGRGAVTPIMNLSLPDQANASRIVPRFEFSFIRHASITEVYDSDYFDKTLIDGVLIGVNNPPP